MRTIFILLFCFPFSLIHSQDIAIPGTKNVNLMDRNKVAEKLVILLIEKTNGSQTRTAFGSGFYINENYIGTCYHLYNSRDGWETVNITAYLNNQVINGVIHPLDTVTATLSTPDKKDQYDFTKHKFDSSDAVTDFVILKLSRKVKSEKNVFIPNWFKSQVRLVAGTAVHQGKSLHPGAADFVPLFTILQGPRSLSIGGVSHLNQGSSGAPMFDSNGNIVAMMQSGADDIQNSQRIMRQLKFEGRVTDWHVEAADHYLTQTPGSSIGFGIQINYLIEKYGKGYFD